MNRIKGLCLAALLIIIGGRSMASDKVTLSTLLDEMISYEKAAEVSDTYYTCKMISGYDRRTVSPDKDWWYANDDGSGCMRLDTIQGRVEKASCRMSCGPLSDCKWNKNTLYFHTPYGGAPRADNPSSHGFNAFVRT